MAIQILKLGLPTAESLLPTKSRVNNQGTPNQLYQQSLSINGTCNTDFIGIKEGWDISWSVLSETDMNAVTAIIELQYSNASHLSFIYTNESGTEITKTVFAEIVGKGALIQRDSYYYSGFAIGLKEC